MRSSFPQIAAALLALCLAIASSVAADTIVLKNGRRIVASDVTDDGVHVSYQTDAGQFQIPKSLVERVERDSYSYTSASSIAAPPIEAPPIQIINGYEDVMHLAVHDNAVDFAYIARADSDARAGGDVAIAKDAAAQQFAAQFLLGKGDIDPAISQYRQALIYAPDNVGLLLNLAALYLRESQFTAAMDPLERARRIEPKNADTAKMLGWAYRGADKIDQAVAEWQRAERLRPDPEVEQALEKASRDKAEEEDYREGETAHFSLKYYGGANPELARGILHALEDDFRDLESQLDYTPPESISVILYTGQAFADITRAPGWVGALNDGRLRIPVQGLNEVNGDLARVLKHELTHSFIGQKSHNRAPTWLQEGLAQWMEGRRSSDSAGALVEAAEQNAIPPLSAMEGSWLGLSGNSAAFAYAWSLAVVESIIDAGGVGDVSRLLDRIATSPSTEAATRETLHSDYSDLKDETVAYLKRAYLR